MLLCPGIELVPASALAELAHAGVGTKLPCRCSGSIIRIAENLPSQSIKAMIYVPRSSALWKTVAVLLDGTMNLFLYRSINEGFAWGRIRLGVPSSVNGDGHLEDRCLCYCPTGNAEQEGDPFLLHSHRKGQRYQRQSQYSPTGHQLKLHFLGYCMQRLHRSGVESLRVGQLLLYR